jgi:hypothetical protein
MSGTSHRRLKIIVGWRPVAALCVVVLAAECALAAPITGGTGPGGFERADASSSLLLWLRSDSITGLSDGSAVSTWANSSTFAVAASNATQSNADWRPTYESGAGDLLNGNPVVRFGYGPNTPNYNNPADALTGTAATGTDKTFFLVIKNTGSPGGCCNGGINTNSHNGLLNTGSRLQADFAGYDYTGTSTTTNTPLVATVTYQNTGPRVGNIKLYRDGAVDGSWTPGDPPGPPALAGTSYQIGSRYDGSPGEYGRYFKGDMAEAGVFNRVLNSAERSIVENSLSAKYNVGLTLSGSDWTLGANDHYAGDTSANGDYDRDVFGIGRVDASNLVTTAGQAGFGIEAAGGTLGDGEWVMAGHKVASNSWTGADMANPLTMRWSRVWYVDKTGSLDATLAFDFSDAGIAPADLGFGYKLLYSPTNAFSFTTLPLIGVVNGDQISFTMSDGMLANGYYTLAQAVPEPSAWILLVVGGMALVGRGRRRRSGPLA